MRQLIFPLRGGHEIVHNNMEVDAMTACLTASHSLIDYFLWDVLGAVFDRVPQLQERRGKGTTW